MLVILGVACLCIGIYSIHNTSRSLRTGIIEQEDGFELRRNKNPVRFRLSIMAVRIFGILMILLSLVLLAGAFLKAGGQ